MTSFVTILVPLNPVEGAGEEAGEAGEAGERVGLEKKPRRKQEDPKKMGLRARSGAVDIFYEYRKVPMASNHGDCNFGGAPPLSPSQEQFANLSHLAGYRERGMDHSLPSLLHSTSPPASRHPA
jgi:hypothetical protein